MDIRTAALAAYGFVPGERGPQGQTLDLADKLIGEERANEARQIKEAGVSPAYRAASKALEHAQINLHAYSRGMISKQVLPSYFQQAREALDRMEAAVSL